MLQESTAAVLVACKAVDLQGLEKYDRVFSTANHNYQKDTVVEAAANDRRAVKQIQSYFFENK